MEEIKQNNKKIIFFLISQTISLFGSSLVQYAIIWYITINTNSGIMMTIATLCGFLPQLLISLFAGVWADRFSRKKLIMYSDASIAISTLVLAILFLIGYDKMWLLFVISAIRSIGSGIQTPSINAVIPQLTAEDKLLKVNSINGTLQSITLLIAPAVSGMLLANATLEMIFFIDVITAIIGISILSFIKIPLHEGAIENSKVDQIKHLFEGIKYVKDSSFLKAFFKYYSIMSFLIVPIAFLTPLLINRIFGENIWYLTLNEMTFFLGSIIGGIALSIWGGFKSKIKTIAFASILSGILIALLGFANVLVVYLILMTISGVLMPYFNAPSISLLQEKTSQDIQGRIFSLVQLIATAMMPLGMVIFGPLADVVSIKYLLIVTGFFLAILGIVMLKDKKVRD